MTYLYLCIRGQKEVIFSPQHLIQITVSNGEEENRQQEEDYFHAIKV